jgi:bifunctional UDP-N-acetylglucosamine pyrophosphorylase/glucosamine-1-phosphate N-acetyltransferase
MDGIILAGGKGTRMRPLTNDTPKPLLNVHDKPILEWSLLSLRPSIDRVLVVAKYLKPQIEAYMANQTIFADYQIVEQLPEPLGTGHALQCCQPHLRSQEFIAINGDDLFHSGSLKQLAQTPFGVLTVDRDDASKWGVVVTDESGRVERLHEKPPEGFYPPPVPVNIGAYKFDQSIFEYDLPLSPRGEYEITDYISWLAQNQIVMAIHCDFWMPIGAPTDLESAQTIDIEHALFSAKD